MTRVPARSARRWGRAPRGAAQSGAGRAQGKRPERRARGPGGGAEPARGVHGARRPAEPSARAVVAVGPLRVDPGRDGTPRVPGAGCDGARGSD